MNEKEWQAIEKARELFKLGDRATMGEIKRAYHRMCKKYHPDSATNSEIVEVNEENERIMYQLTLSHELLMRYTREYRFPLTPGKGDVYDAEDWWMDRFGQDPLWGKGKKQG